MLLQSAIMANVRALGPCEKMILPSAPMLKFKYSLCALYQAMK